MHRLEPLGTASQLKMSKSRTGLKGHSNNLLRSVIGQQVFTNRSPTTRRVSPARNNHELSHTMHKRRAATNFGCEEVSVVTEWSPTSGNLSVIDQRLLGD